jgi:uncharacterized protein (DUF305 family)
MKKLTLAAALAGLVLGGGAIAQPTNPHAGHSGNGAPQLAAPGSAKAAYEAANARMHKDMAIAYTGDADIDFARGMIPHHQGAIDMAKIVLEYGKDAELKKLAQEVISAQEEEIAFLKDWLKKKGQ